MDIRNGIRRALPASVLSFVLNVKDLIQYTRPFRFPTCPIIQTPRDTLIECLTLLRQGTRGAYSRFGDGDIFILSGRGEQFHKANAALALEIREALAIRDPSFLKGLGINSKQFGLEPEMRPRVHERSDRFARYLLHSVYEYFIGQKIYSAVALHHCIIYEKELSVSLLSEIRRRRPILVTGRHNDRSVCRKLFDPRLIIIVPSSDSYSHVDTVESEILRECRESGEAHHTIVLSCGLMARALAKRIHKNQEVNAFVFDCGSVLDAFQEKKQWGWVVDSGVGLKYWSEYLAALEDASR